MARESRSIVFAGGGTGGHLFPALAVAAELRGRQPGDAIRFVGGRRGIEREQVPRAGYPLRTLPLEGIQGRSVLGKFRAGFLAGWALLRCIGWMAAWRPDLVIGMGGYASGPAVLAARLLRRRTMVLEQNHFPGATNRWLAPRVHAICLPSEAARERVGGRGIVTGNPVRPEFLDIGEPPGGPELSLLVFGGSRGARSINRAMLAALPRLARFEPPPRIVHQTGVDDREAVEEAYRAYPAGRYEVHTFLDDMPARLAASDLVVCRAGAGTLAELAAAGRPAILIPYPHAADDHQRHNAETVGSAGAARVVLDPDLDGDALADCIGELTDDAEGRRLMAHAARSLARPHAAQRIADVAEALIAGRDPESLDVP